jgi:hypothetical protein
MLENALGLAQGKVVQTTHCRPLFFKLRESCSGKLRMGDKLPALLQEVGFLDMPVEQPVSIG